MEIFQTSLDYNDFANKIYSHGIFTDAWLNGKPRFSTDCLTLEKSELNAFYKAAEDIGELFNEFMSVIETHEELLDTYFNLTPFQKTMWYYSHSAWHGISRLDLFLLKNGQIQMCEMNSDTPSGEPEAVALNEYFESELNLENPNKNFKRDFINTLIKLWKYETGKNDAEQKPRVGIIYPTELSEDLSMIRLYDSWFQEYGIACEKGSPFNLKYSKNDKSVMLFNKKLDIALRHYKTDWWGERIAPWLDAEFLDSEPLAEQISWLIKANQAGNLSIFNPLGSVLTQNKLTLAFFYDYYDMFSSKSQDVISKYIPESRRLIDYCDKIAKKDDWTIKSNYGCEGDEVIIGRNVSQEIWEKTIELARKEYWIVQKYFDSIRINDYEPNFGVYLIGGKASGIFTRFSKKSTDYYSLSLPTFIK